MCENCKFKRVREVDPKNEPESMCTTRSTSKSLEPKGAYEAASRSRGGGQVGKASQRRVLVESPREKEDSMALTRLSPPRNIQPNVESQVSASREEEGESRLRTPRIFQPNVESREDLS